MMTCGMRDPTDRYQSSVRTECFHVLSPHIHPKGADCEVPPLANLSHCHVVHVDSRKLWQQLRGRDKRLRQTAFLFEGLQVFERPGLPDPERTRLRPDQFFYVRSAPQLQSEFMCNCPDVRSRRTVHAEPGCRSFHRKQR